MEPRTGNPVGKELHLRMDHMEEVRVVAHALSSDVRLRILAMIGATSMNVNEIARELGAPVSTTALNIQVLERAGLVSCEMQPGTRGAMKMCVRGIDRVHISLSPTPRAARLGMRNARGLLCAGGRRAADLRHGQPQLQDERGRRSPLLLPAQPF